MSLTLINHCRQLIQAYHDGLLGNMKMPEDVHPDFGDDQESRLAFFTLPMALNYQRNSYKLWEAATQTYQDTLTTWVFNNSNSAQASTEQLQSALIKHKVAIQPNKHTQTRQTISNTITESRGSITQLLETTSYDFLKLQQLIQVTHKKGFPYLSGPKIFHYRSYILGEYCSIKLSNRQYIEIAPDTHVIQCSIKLGVITQAESTTLTRDQISAKRRSVLMGSGIDPIDMHSPLWFWSRNNFMYELKTETV